METMFHCFFSLLFQLEHGAKAHLKHLTEYFSLLYDFSKMGEEESQFLIAVHAISLMVNFYLGPKSNEFVSTILDGFKLDFSRVKVGF